MQKRKLLNSPRLLELKKKRRRIFLDKILLLMLGFFVVCAGLSYVSRINRLNINKIEVTGNKVLDAETIKKAVQEKITGNYLWILPRTNVLLYPENKVKSELLNNFKRIKDITLSIKDRNTLEVSISEREAKYIWCGKQADLEDEQQCYFMDENSFIFDEAPYFSGEVYFKFYGSASVGSYFSQQNFEQLISFKKALENFGLKPAGLTILNNGDIKMLLSPGSSSSTQPEIIFKKDANLEKVAENLEAALTTEPLQSKFKNKYASLLYIDLRYGNKVYYKFR